MASTRALRFHRLEGDCLVCLSHCRRPDGYFRKEWQTDQGTVIEYFHVFIYRMHFGGVPDGYEIDHICNNRACCNPKHLRPLTVSQNRTRKNTSHTMIKFEEAQDYWLRHKPSNRVLGETFDVSRMTATRWINKWSTLDQSNITQ